MGFSQEWNEQYNLGKQLSLWPWSDLVSYIMRYARPHKKEFKVLELGCGAGANIPFFQSLGVEYYAIEGSITMVQELHKKFPTLAKNILCGDFTQDIPFHTKFDLVVDRASLTHNTTSAIRQCLDIVNDLLNEDGKFIGIDWFSVQHADYLLGAIDEDSYSRNNFTNGQFVGIGRVHFSDREHLQDLFRNFALEVMEHKIIKREDASKNHTFAAWNFVASKKGGHE